eukprot:7980494-Alexandrium_andersonii.AAC.1
MVWLLRLWTTRSSRWGASASPSSCAVAPPGRHCPASMVRVVAELFGDGPRGQGRSLDGTWEPSS